MVSFQIYFTFLGVKKKPHNFISTRFCKEKGSENITEEPTVDGIRAIFIAELTFTSRSIAGVTALLHVMWQLNKVEHTHTQSQTFRWPAGTGGKHCNVILPTHIDSVSNPVNRKTTVVL